MNGSRHNWLWMLLMPLFVACGGRQHGLPSSGGRPYEVLIACSDSSARRALSHLLQSDVEALPQPEPMFDVSTADSPELNSSTTLARNIVIATIDSARYTAPKLHYEKNVYAQPQMIVYVQAPSAASLLAAESTFRETLLQLLTRAELNREVSRLQQRHNTEAEQAIRQLLGADMLVPQSLHRMKQGADFLWLSDDGETAIRNICIYRIATPKAGSFPAVHDSVLCQNIKGETDEMCFQSVKGSWTFAPHWQTTQPDQTGRLTARGLWQMEGDAMGGPFVVHAIERGDSLWVAEAFVYAPAQKKRNMMRQLEAALYTFNTLPKHK